MCFTVHRIYDERYTVKQPCLSSLPMASDRIILFAERSFAFIRRMLIVTQDANPSLTCPCSERPCDHVTESRAAAHNCRSVTAWGFKSFRRRHIRLEPPFFRLFLACGGFLLFFSMQSSAIFDPQNISITTMIMMFATVFKCILRGNMKQSSTFFGFELDMINTGWQVQFSSKDTPLKFRKLLHFHE